MRVKLGLIGLGNILESHLAGIREHSAYQIAGVCDRDEARARCRAQALACPGLTDYHDLLALKPDAVLVALPHGLHCPVTIAALEAGCHVLVEKPMAVSAAECLQMLQAARRCQRQILVADSASYDPGAQLTGRKFQAGLLGRFFTGQVPQIRAYFSPGRPAWFLDPAMSGGGMFSNVGLHRLALARACLPGLTPLLVSAAVSRLPEYTVEACTTALVKYKEGGAMLYEETGYFPRPDWLPLWRHFVFEKGIVTWDTQIWRLFDGTGHEYREPLPPPLPSYVPVYGSLLGIIRGETHVPSAADYAVDVAIVHAAYTSAREQREISIHDFYAQVMNLCNYP